MGSLLLDYNISGNNIYKDLENIYNAHFLGNIRDVERLFAVFILADNVEQLKFLLSSFTDYANSMQDFEQMRGDIVALYNLKLGKN